MIARLKKWLWRPSRDELQRRLTVVTEERDVLQERAYDLHWHLERAQAVAQQYEALRPILRPGEIRTVHWREEIKRDFDADCC